MQESGTKQRIIDAALGMFAAGGYDKVTIRDIAYEAGITSGSIYGHFESKEQILWECYNFYLERRHDTRLRREEYLPIIKSGTKQEVVQAINYTYSEEILERMIMAMLVVFSRLYIDKRAMEVYADEINSSMEYLTGFFRAGIDLGRFYEFNVPSISLIYLSTRLYTAQSVVLEPEQKSKWRQAESEMFEELIKIIPFRY